MVPTEHVSHGDGVAYGGGFYGDYGDYGPNPTSYNEEQNQSYHFVPSHGNPGANIAGAQPERPSGPWMNMLNGTSNIGLGHGYGQHGYYPEFTNMIGMEYTQNNYPYVRVC